MKRSEPDHAAVADGLDRWMLWARRNTPSHISSTSITTLDTLEYSGPLRITELAEREGVSQPGMTTLVNRLEDEGYAERFADPTDGRVTLVRITPVGRRVLGERHAARAAALRPLIDKLPTEHQRALAAAMNALDALIQNTPTYETSAR